MAVKLNWFDMKLAFITASDRRVEANPAEITQNFSTDPIVDVACRHAYVEIGFRYLMRDLLQIAMAPADADTWADRMENPPFPEELARRLAPYRPAFFLDDDATPAMQVRPTQLLAGAKKAESSGKRSKVRGEPDDDDEGDDDEGEGTTPISALLPDAPTKNNLEKDTDFFTKRDGVSCIGAGAILPVLYAHMVLFPQTGGGYFGLPHGPDSIKFAVRGRTLWASIWANVLGPTDDDGRPVPCDQTVFAWLDPNLGKMPLGRKDVGARRSIARSAMHASFLPLPRRYLLAAPITAQCDLTDVDGPGFTNYKRWPAGLQYEAKNWTMPFVAERKTYSFGANGWRLKTTAADNDEGAKVSGPTFVKARGPLRFDDWLELSLDTDEELPATAKPEDVRRRVERPGIVVGFQSRATSLVEEDRSSTLAADIGFRLEAIAASLDGKVMATLSRRQLPLWRVRDQAATIISYAATEMLKIIREMANAVEVASKTALATASMKAFKLPNDLHDALLVNLDSELLDLREKVYSIFAGTDDALAAERRLPTLKYALAQLARRRALALFDETFPIATIDAATIRVLRARRVLRAKLYRLTAKVRPSEGNDMYAARTKGKKRGRR
jgi:CRISPR system Cascade subunit CasA